MFTKSIIQKKIVLLVFMLGFTAIPMLASAQDEEGLDKTLESIPMMASQARTTEFRNRVDRAKTFKSSKIPNAVKFNVGDLRSMLDNLADTDTVSFHFVTLKAEDAVNYPGLTEAQKQELEGKLTLLVKAKNQSSRLVGKPPVVLGTICPPPAGSCD